MKICPSSNYESKLQVRSKTFSNLSPDAISAAAVTGPTATLVAGNSSANLSCQAAAGKVTEVFWWKGEQVLTATNRLVFSDDKSSLVISLLQKDDGGEYRCLLRNPVSETKATYRMVVNCECLLVTGSGLWGFCLFVPMSVIKRSD